MYPVQRLCVKMVFAHGLPTCCLTPGGSGGGCGHGACILALTRTSYGTARYPLLLTSLPVSISLYPSGRPRMPGEHCSVLTTVVVYCSVGVACIVSDMGLGPNGTINGFRKKKSTFLRSERR